MNFFIFSFLSFFAVVFSFSCGNVESTCYYVNVNLNSGSKDGSDWNNAANALPATLQRGWTYYIANGTYSSLALDDTESGSQMIYIYSAQVGNHGTSVGWNVNLAGSVMFWGGISISKGYYHVDGQVGGGPGSWDSGYGMKVSGHFTANYGSLIYYQNSPSNVTLSHIGKINEKFFSSVQTFFQIVLNGT